MKKAFFYFTLFFLLTITQVFCQDDFKPGYIITNDFDTIHGFINLRFKGWNNRECEFRKQENGPSKLYFPFGIYGYRIEEYKFFVSKKIYKNNIPNLVFLEFLVKGKANLYHYKDSLNDTYFIEKDTLLSQLEKIETEFINEYGDDKVSMNNKYKGTLSYLFQDASDISTKIQVTDYSMRDFVKITKQYHNSVCEGEECIDYTKSLKVKMYIQPYTGIVQTNLIIETSGNIDENVKPIFGANLVFSPKRLNYKFNFSTGVSFSSNNFNGIFYNSFFSKNKRYRISLDYTVLRIPLIFEYVFSRNNIQPFLSVGYNAAIILSPEWEVVQVYETESITDYLELNTHFSNYHHAFIGGGGVKFVLKNESNIFIKGQYEYRYPFSLNIDFMDLHSTSSIFLTIGYALKLN